ncbi:MAG TPA: hypothetical protein VGL99_01490 [Chloroflexota bacterium]
MRLPRHDTALTLSAEQPREALAHDEALLVDGVRAMRWYTVTAPAIVLGLALHHRAAEVVDYDRCRARGVEVLHRSAGGGAVLLDDGMLCCTVCLPLPDDRVSQDLTESYRWLGDYFARRVSGRRVEVAEARADTASVGPGLLRDTCYGVLSPHEVVNSDGAKIVGLAQVRRRYAALFQVGILLRDQSPLADLLRVSDEPTREALRTALRRRSAPVSVGLIQPEQFL